MECFAHFVFHPYDELGNAPLVNCSDASVDYEPFFFSSFVVCHIGGSTKNQGRGPGKTCVWYYFVFLRL